MGIYVKRPIKVEATQWKKIGDHSSVRILTNDVRWGGILCYTCGEIMRKHGLIETLEGTFKVCPGDWIVKGIEGELYPIKPDIFIRTYAPEEEVN